MCDDLYTIRMGILEDALTFAVPYDDRVVRAAGRKFRTFPAVGHRIDQILVAS